MSLPLEGFPPPMVSPPPSMFPVTNTLPVLSTATPAPVAVPLDPVPNFVDQRSLPLLSKLATQTRPLLVQ